MLNKKERALLRYVLEQCPNPNAQHYVKLDDRNPKAVDRLHALGLIKKQGFNPVTYQITLEGRQYFRDQKETAKSNRRHWWSITLRDVCVALITAAVVQILNLIFGCH